MCAFKIVTVNYANDPHIEILFPSQLPPLCLDMVKGAWTGRHGREAHSSAVCKWPTLTSCAQMALQLMSIMVSRAKLAPAKDVSKSDCCWITAKWGKRARELLKGTLPARHLVGFAVT